MRVQASASRAAATERSGVLFPIALAGCVLLVAFGSFAAWSRQVRLESRIVAPGTLVPERPRQAVQHPVGGVLAEILVREGQIVAAGDMLLRFDETHRRTTIDRVTAALAVAVAREARLRAERDDSETLDFPPSTAATRRALDAQAAERSIFIARREQRADQARTLAQKAREIQVEIRALGEELEALDRQLALARQEAARLQKLAPRNAERNAQLAALTRAEPEFEARRAQIQARIAQQRQAMAEDELRMTELRRQRHDEVVRMLRDEQARIVEIRGQLQAAEASASRSVVPAPAGGRVVSIRTGPVGSVIEPHVTLMEISPPVAGLIVEAPLPIPHDAAIGVGCPVAIRRVSADRPDPDVVAARVIEVRPHRPATAGSEASGSVIRAAVLPGQGALATVSPGPDAGVEVIVPSGVRTLFERLAFSAAGAGSESVCGRAASS